MKVNVLKYGGRGVDIVLKSFSSPGPDTVFWSKPDPSTGRGGCNSFVCVEDPRGFWLTEDGQRVNLISINGIGEIRWTIDGSHMVHWAEGSVEHFKLKEAPR